jgi:hypothetical protein
MNTKTDQKWVFFYDTDHILNEVQNFTATIASRPSGKEGEMRPFLIMTHDHEDLFLRLIKDAMSDIRTAVYKHIEPEHPSDDMRRVDRIHIHTTLRVSEAEDAPAIVRVLDDKIREYLITRIIFGWLLLKAPEEAEYYVTKASDILDTIKRTFSHGDKRVRRRYLYY